MASVLVVEDNQTMREGVEITLRRLGLDVSLAGESAYALELLGARHFDLVVTDYKLPGKDGLELFRAARQLQPGIDTVLITAFGSVDLAVEAMKAGVADFLTKPFSPDELTVKVQKVLEARTAAIESRRLAAENELLRTAVEDAGGAGSLVGESTAMREVFSLIEQVAPTDSSVLITGESGTGKELVARAIHERSLRRDRPFVKVACAALSESLLESELFGHEKGAFTGSVKTRRGRFELADGGTLFLDEIGEVSPTVQVKLLRVLQEREFERVGGEQTVSVNVRLVSATNRDLRAQVEKGAFREDLYYRLHVVPIHLPPLRERAGDIEILARHLADKLCRRMNRAGRGFSAEALGLLRSHRWPGNVRELENIIERALVLGRGDRILPEDFPALDRAAGGPPPTPAAMELPAGGTIDLASTLAEAEKKLIRQALERSGGNKSRAARLLGLKNSVLHYKLEKYGLL
ncbi:MAG: sigma-54 dependent transcriptional regulator [Candidatus Glassbacteria bacterium]